MDIEDLIQDHYRGAALVGGLMAALTAAGQDTTDLTAAQLALVDQLHAGGLGATRHLFTAMDLGPANRLLDVGSGIGGPARLAAADHGCTVVGIDLSTDFVAAATALTELVDLSELVRFRATSATETGLDDDAFDRASLIHVGMNLPEKVAVFTEVRRVLRSGGVFGLYEQMRVGSGELTFPMPWAADERSSFVASPDDYARDLTAAGFRVVHQEVRTMDPGPSPSGLDPRAVFGPVFLERLNNNVAAARAGLLAPVLVLAT